MWSYQNFEIISRAIAFKMSSTVELFSWGLFVRVSSYTLMDIFIMGVRLINSVFSIVVFAAL